MVPLRRSARLLGLSRVTSVPLINTLPLVVRPSQGRMLFDRLTLVVALLVGLFSALGNEAMAQALAPSNIFVYAVAPGFVETDMAAFLLSAPEGDDIRAQSPLNRAARPEEVARAVLFLAAEGTDYLTGCIIDVNGASYLRS